MNPNPYESPRSEIPFPTEANRQQFASHESQTQVAWGATSCFWGFLVMLTFVFGSRGMLMLHPAGSWHSFYEQLIYWGGWISASLQLVGLFLLCFIGEQTGSKTLFKLAFGCYLADQSWALLPYLESERTEIPPAIQYLALLISMLAQLFIYLALRRVSQFTQDRQMLRWSAWGLWLFVIVFFLNASFEALNLFGDVAITDLRYVWKNHSIPYGYWLSSALGFFGLPLLYCYPRLLKRMAFWWERIPEAEAVG